MRECPKCGQEYLDSVSVCAEDGTALLPEKPTPPEPKNDISRLATLATLADRFEADELAQDLADEGFEVGIVSNKGPTVGPLITPGPLLYSIVVPDSQVARAAALLAEWRPAIEEDRAGAERAAEEEEAATEAAKA